MAKKFRDLIAKLPPERQERIRQRVASMLAEMPPQQLRHSREFEQDPRSRTKTSNEPE